MFGFGTFMSLIILVVGVMLFFAPLMIWHHVSNSSHKLSLIRNELQNLSIKLSDIMEDRNEKANG